MTFLFETPTVRGDFNNHPDLNAFKVLVTFNQSSFRNYADKKLYVRYNYYRQYTADARWPATNFEFFFLFTPLVKGPYGLEPLFDVKYFNQNITGKFRERTAVLGWTSLYPAEEHTPFGYTAEMVKEMHKVMTEVNYTFRVIEFDAVHASWSGDLLKSLYFVTTWVMFFIPETTEYTEKLVNVPHLDKMVKECGLNRTYLKVHDSIRDFIIPPPPTKKKRQARFHAKTGVTSSVANLIVSLLTPPAAIGLFLYLILSVMLPLMVK